MLLIQTTIFSKMDVVDWNESWKQEVIYAENIDCPYMSATLKEKIGRISVSRIILHPAEQTRSYENLVGFSVQIQGGDKSQRDRFWIQL